jgi:hypothetical protein
MMFSTLRDTSKKNMEVLVMFVAKDKCFYFAHNEDVDEEGRTSRKTKSHFDFGLFGNLNGSEYNDEDGKKFCSCILPRRN